MSNLVQKSAFFKIVHISEKSFSFLSTSTTSTTTNDTTTTIANPTKLIDYATDDSQQLVLMDLEEESEPSNYSGSGYSTEDQDSSDNETTTTTLSSSVESDFSSFDNSSDEEGAHSLPSSFTEEEQLIQEASTDPTIILARISTLLKRIRKLISIILKSSVLNRYVNKEIKSKENANNQIHQERNKKHRLRGFTLDMNIRWSSTFIMLSRFLLHSSIINSITHNASMITGVKRRQCRTLRKLSFSSLDWTILKAVEHVLAPFNDGTKILSNRHQPTLFITHSVVHALKSIFTTVDNAPLTLENVLKQHLLLVFNFYYEKHVTDEQKTITLVRRNLHI